MKFILHFTRGLIFGEIRNIMSASRTYHRTVCKLLKFWRILTLWVKGLNYSSLVMCYAKVYMCIFFLCVSWPDPSRCTQSVLLSLTGLSLWKGCVRTRSFSHFLQIFFPQRALCPTFYASSLIPCKIYQEAARACIYCFSCHMVFVLYTALFFQTHVIGAFLING